MKKILLISDSHGDWDVVSKIFEKEEGNYDFSIFLGDFVRQEQYYINNFDIAVPGNNDWSSELSRKVEFVINDQLKAIAFHSEEFGYFNRDQKMAQWAHAQKIDIIFCGHTHVPKFVKINNVTIINPGSCSLPRSKEGKTYAILEIENDNNLKFHLKNI